jgi:hypothetical protein
METISLLITFEMFLTPLPSSVEDCVAAAALTLLPIVHFMRRRFDAGSPTCFVVVRYGYK